VYFYKHGNHVALFYRSLLKKNRKMQDKVQGRERGENKRIEVNLR